METLRIQNDAENSRFSAVLGDHLALLNYTITAGNLQIDYVYVPEEHRGQGIGGQLVKAALEYAQAHGLRPVPVCGFARVYLQQHPEYQVNPGFDEIMSRYAPAIQDLAFRTRNLIYLTYPRVVEVPWVQQGTIGYGVGPKKMSEHFSWISAHQNHVNLGFFYGAELPDPTGLLEGAGKLLRHVKIRKPEDLEDPALHALLKVATTHRMPPRTILNSA